MAMTAASLLAAAAGGVAALGATDLAQAWSATRRAPAPSRLALALLLQATGLVAIHRIVRAPRA